MPRKAETEEQRRERKEKKKREKPSVPDEANGKPQKRKRNSADIATNHAEAEVKENVDDERDAKVLKAPENGSNDTASLDRSGLSTLSKQALLLKGVSQLFPIQQQTLDASLTGVDLVGRAKTGQGKTLAFGLPLVERISPSASKRTRAQARGCPLAIVVTPTRELAKQVHTELEPLTTAHALRCTCVYGGAQYQPQQQALRNGIDVVVGTPGRIKDFMSEDRNQELRVTHIMVRILDEADRMLDMGFREDVEHILGGASAQSVQTLLFSATLPKSIKNIANSFLNPDHKIIDLVNEEGDQAATTIDHVLLPCQWSERASLIADVVRKYGANGKAVIFCETKKDVSEIAEAVSERIDGGVREIHGDLTQTLREQVLAAFRKDNSDPKAFRCLVATDVAARGLDINTISLIVQCEPPRDADTYIHRAGRTARAGSTGTSVLLSTKRHEGAAEEIERKCGIKFRREAPPQQSDLAAGAVEQAAETLTSVQPRAAELFKHKASELVNSREDPETLLSKALACIAGFSSLQDRSLLSSHSGVATLVLRVPSEIRAPGFVWSLLKRRLDQDTVECIRRMSLLEDRRGAVFDVPSEHLDTFLNLQQDDSFEIQLATEIPPLAQKPNAKSYSNAQNVSYQQRGGRAGGRNQHSGRGGRRRC